MEPNKRERLEYLLNLQALGTFEATDDSCSELETLKAEFVTGSQASGGSEHGG
jgi:hypothetical protein